jgi:hypothetical protein
MTDHQALAIIATIIYSGEKFSRGDYKLAVIDAGRKFRHTNHCPEAGAMVREVNT